jgi:hypothetical protein
MVVMINVIRNILCFPCIVYFLGVEIPECCYTLWNETER